ncbi:MAG TPA: chemotaxis protein CheW [Polyangiaceae bacterium]|nr:chemotaxis protein CheW [Polyangiaceae bacterium]
MSVPLLPVRIESEWLLIDATLIQEILGAQPWLSIPHTRRELPGVVAWRGRALPLVDLGAVLGLGALTSKLFRARTLIGEVDGGLLAVSVDEAREVRIFTADQIRAAHAVPRPHSVTEAELQGMVMPILDLRSLLASLTRPHAADSTA